MLLQKELCCGIIEAALTMKLCSIKTEEILDVQTNSHLISISQRWTSGSVDITSHWDTHHAKALKITDCCILSRQLIPPHTTHLKQQPFQLLCAPAALLHWADDPLVFLATPKKPSSPNLHLFISHQKHSKILGNRLSIKQLHCPKKVSQNQIPAKMNSGQLLSSKMRLKPNLWVRLH